MNMYSFHKFGNFDIYSSATSKSAAAHSLQNLNAPLKKREGMMEPPTPLLWDPMHASGWMVRRSRANRVPTIDDLTDLSLAADGGVGCHLLVLVTDVRVVASVT